MAASILLVEDNINLSKALKTNLGIEGFNITQAFNLEQAREQELGAVDLILLDINLPDGLGTEFCIELRDKGKNIPVIFLTANDDEKTIVEALSMGANDYIKKPFSNKELLARIQVQLRKNLRELKKIKYKDVTLNLDSRTLEVQGKTLELNRRHFDILQYFFQNPDYVVSREKLIAALASEDVLDRTIDSHISRLRVILRKNKLNQVQIQSIYGIGYKLE